MADDSEKTASSTPQQRPPVTPNPTNFPYSHYLPSEQAARLAQESPKEARSRSNHARSTRHILVRFTASAPEQLTPEERQRRHDWDRRRRRALDQLERLADPPTRSRLSHLLRRGVGSGKLKTRMEPLDIEAREACQFWFQEKSAVKVHITDFKETSAHRREIKLGELDQYLENKPSDVVVRWIHVPLGKGLLQSTIEDMFRFTGSADAGYKFSKGSADPSWPYPEVNMLTFVNFARYIDKMNAFRVLSDMDVLVNGTGGDPLHGFSKRQKDDLNWRAGHLGIPISYWDMVRADLPNPLGEKFLGQASNQNDRGALPTHNDGQALADHPSYENSLLMTSLVRTFQRSDGYMLSFADQSGVDYLGKPFREWLDLPDACMENPDTSCLAHVAECFLDSGVSRWHRKTVEWLIVYILTEAAVTPHNIRQGRNSISLLTAYQDLAKQLKQRQKRPWERGESPKLVRKYLNCLEELRAITDLANKKLMVLRGLLEDVERLEAEYDAKGLPTNPPTNPDDSSRRSGSSSPNTDELETEPMTDRINWAIDMIEEQRRDASFLVDYFTTALNELFQLRSIEQNEMAIVADSQNKAIILFTGVTIVFLPLSFMTSYWGMNLRGIADTTLDQNYFWSTCGTVSFMLVLIIVVFGFRHDIVRGLEDKGILKKKPAKIE